MRIVSLVLPLTIWWSTAVATDQYDVIVIGSGAAGLTAAEFLTRDANVSVLLLEAGLPSLWATGGRDSPSYVHSEPLTKFDIPGEFSSVIYNPANEKYRMDGIEGPDMWLGKMVGGCSSIHASLYFQPPDAYVTDTNWPFKPDHVNELFKENEKLFGVTDVPSPDGNDVLASSYDLVRGALQAAGYSEMKINDQDARNNKDKTFGHAPYTIKDGQRDVPAKTFYGAMQRRVNFKLITSAVVSHIVQTQGKATAVVYNDGIQVDLTARGAVIVAAGALNTPKVLIQSGIGPQDQLDLLSKLGDQFPGVNATAGGNWIVNDNVGKHLFDTNVVFASFTHPKMESFNYASRPEAAIEQYMTKDYTGPWSSPGPLMIGYENYVVNDRKYQFQITLLPSGFVELANVPNSFATSLYVNNPEGRDFASFSSDGKWHGLTKNSLYLATPNDLEAMESFVTKVVETMENAGAKFISATSGQSVKDWVAASGANRVTHHFGGTCYTSNNGQDTNRCADEQFVVIGTSNIFVGDASLMKEGTVNPYGFIIYAGRETGSNVKAFLTNTPVDPTTRSSMMAGGEDDTTPGKSNTSIGGGLGLSSFAALIALQMAMYVWWL